MNSRDRKECARAIKAMRESIDLEDVVGIDDEKTVVTKPDFMTPRTKGIVIGVASLLAAIIAAVLNELR